jgi:hypothetical protein
MGLLTERATKTLIFYLMELNPTLMQWLEVCSCWCVFLLLTARQTQPATVRF